MQIVMPMAGQGRRFVEAGYDLPKPLIPVGGVPMFARALADLPAATRHVFVCLGEHADRFGLPAAVRAHCPDADIVVLSAPTSGQACTVWAALDRLDPAEDVLVCACDNTHVFAPRRWLAASAPAGPEALVWTFREDDRVLRRPTAWSWVRTNAAGLVEQVRVKQPLSDDPKADHAVTGTFWFRRPEALAEAIDRTVTGGRQTGGEVYLDDVVNEFLEAGGTAGVFEVDQYIGWGTPEDLQQWERTGR